jgi:hypothetical protein
MRAHAAVAGGAVAATAAVLGNAFVLGLLVCVLPLAGLLRSVRQDERSRWALLPYTAYAVRYDVPWPYRLWRLNLSGRR